MPAPFRPSRVGPGAAAGTLVLVAFGIVSLAGQAGETPASSDEAFRLIQKVGAYVDTFQKQFGSMVSEERYEQSVRLGAMTSGRTTRGALPEGTVLKSDFLLVQVPGEGWLPFRDVFERDGRKLRDREERLAKLFLAESGTRTAIEQAQSIMNESARYNIGNVNRNINVPTLVLTLLTPLHRSRLQFEQRKTDDLGTIVDFKETSQPTYVRTTGGRDLPVYGRFWADPADGTIRKTELHAVDPAVEAHITVTFARDEAAGMVVP